MLRQPIKTLYSKTVTATSNGTDTFVIDVNDFDALIAKIAVPTLAGSGTLDVYLQTSFDGGSNWVDVVHFTQITATLSNPLYAMISAVGNVFKGAVGDAVISAGTLGVPFVGKNARLKYVFGGSISSISFTVTLYQAQQSGAAF
jgi:hypothetical protein